MLLQLGLDCFVKTKDIIMILDYEKAVCAQDTKLFLKNKQTAFTCENPKSIVVAEKGGEYMLYYSPVLSTTLLSRAQKHNLY